MQLSRITLSNSSELRELIDEMEENLDYNIVVGLAAAPQPPFSIPIEEFDRYYQRLERLIEESESRLIRDVYWIGKRLVAHANRRY